MVIRFVERRGEAVAASMSSANVMSTTPRGGCSSVASNP